MQTSHEYTAGTSATKDASRQGTSSTGKASGPFSVIARVSAKKDQHCLTDTDVEMKDIEAAKKSNSRKKNHKTSNQQDYYPNEAPITPTVITLTSETVKAVQGRDEVVLLTFQDVKSPLEAAGFVFRENLYCRPGMDPKQHPSAVVGQDYFTTEQAFRENLCAYGLEDCDKWTKDTRGSVEPWIRYSIVKSLRSRTHIPGFHSINGKRAWNILQKLGFREKHTKMGINYLFPGAKSDELGTLQFDDQKAFYIHLRRFGLPDNCNYDQITVDERIQLETYLATEFVSRFVSTL
jgi:hypothetical protein